MRATLRNHARPDGPTFIDSVKLAREALVPSLMVLAGRGSGAAIHNEAHEEDSETRRTPRAR